jgi:DNA repair protein RadD
MLRPYQQEAFEQAKAWMSKTIDPCVIEAATGAGKSHIIAAIAEWVVGKGRVLCLAPNKELVEQNREKYLATGRPASIMSASAGSKCLKHQVVFGTPLTVLNAIKRMGDKFICVVVDEAHMTTPTIKEVIHKLKEKQPNLRVVGLTATPYRLGDGYIYEMDTDGRKVEEVREPYFMKCIYRITAWELIEAGFLTPPLIGGTQTQYDTSGLVIDRKGQFTADSVDRAFIGKGRLTSEIVADVVLQSVGRMGVMIFASTVAHAVEIMESLPPELSRMIGGKINTAKADRKKLVDDFKARKYKYLVSVGTMTTGVDFTHVDVIALLRATESPGLLQQIIGRGSRLHEHKENFLLLDYAGNIERHFPHGDVFKPEIKSYKKGTTGTLTVNCPTCAMDNEFAARPNPSQFKISPDGYFLDLDGYKMEMPAHFGRRCQNYVLVNYQHVQCAQRWAHKKCTECGHENDIAARYCESCKAEIIDPNEKLRLDFAKRKADPHSRQTDPVLAVTVKHGFSMNGNERLEIKAQTTNHLVRYYASSKTMSTGLNKTYRDFVVTCFGRIEPEWTMEQIAKAVNAMDKPPFNTITYEKVQGKPFFQVYGYNGAADEVS